MTLVTEFVPLTIAELPSLSATMLADNWRFVQILAVNTEDGIDLIYSFMKDNSLMNHEIKGVKKGTEVPSITDRFLSAFVFENEIHDLFGVDVKGMAIDFGGNFYALAQKEPMTVISPAQKAAREKAAKIAAAKAAKEKKAAQEAESTSNASEKQADIEGKLAGLDPEKAAKVKAALEAKAAREKAKAAAEQEGE